MFFHKAFGQSLIPGFDSMTIPLYIGDPIRIEGSYEDEQVRQEEYKRRLQRIPGINRKIHTFQDTEDPSQNSEIKETFQLDAGRFLLFEPLVGFEPTTPRLQITCSGQLS